jgi:hypothetical protein
VPFIAAVCALGGAVVESERFGTEW